MPRARKLCRCAVALLSMLVLQTCSDDVIKNGNGTADGAARDSRVGGDAQPVGDGTVITDGSTATDGATASDGTAGDGPATDIWVPTNQPACNGQVFACSNGLDDDNDGRPDAQDPECVGPCDDDEGSFATGISGDNSDPCNQDCFFDGNSGGGQEKCNWNLGCDAAYTQWAESQGQKVCKLPNGCEDRQSPTCKCNDETSQQCKTACLPLTPNGCDCYGCCTVFKNGVSSNVYLGSGPTCSSQTPENCAPCTPQADCLNDCGECELCLGRTIDQLPAHCFASPDGGVGPDGGSGTDGGGVDSGPPPSLCEAGVTACPNLNHDECPAGHYCLTGCCVPVVIY